MPLTVRPWPEHANVSDSHPSVRAYAAASQFQSPRSMTEVHTDIWMNGYQRFGARFERAAKSWLRAKRPRPLQTYLADPWNIMGLNESELTDETKLLLGSVDFDEGDLTEFLLKIADVQPPARFLELANWVGVAAAGYHGIGWPYFVLRSMGAPTSWTFEDALVLLDSGLASEHIRLVFGAGVTDLASVLAAARGDIAIEYAAAGN